MRVSSLDAFEIFIESHVDGVSFLDVFELLIESHFYGVSFLDVFKTLIESWMRKRFLRIVPDGLHDPGLYDSNSC